VTESPRLVIHSPLDEKPKRVVDPHDLERVRDILERPEVALLVDRWSEDWSRLGWLRLRGLAEVVEPGDQGEEHAAAVAALRGKYPQYETHRLEERPLIRIVIERSRSWGNLESSQRSR
jgi:PPOX class probable F420-dependent enzyme